jgi:hypothetical protein
MKINQRQQNQPTITLRLLDLDQAKAAVLASLRSPGSRRCYEHAMVEFIAWYCSEPRLGFNKAVVTLYRMHLESRGLAPGTVSLPTPMQQPHHGAVHKPREATGSPGPFSPLMFWHPAIPTTRGLRSQPETCCDSSAGI